MLRERLEWILTFPFRLIGWIGLLPFRVAGWLVDLRKSKKEQYEKSVSGVTKDFDAEAQKFQTGGGETLQRKAGLGHSGEEPKKPAA